MATENKLKDWRFGQAQAERLAASILSLRAYEDIEPQAPLGGGDGAKDILCSRGGNNYVAAVYFPSTNKTYSQIKSKFISDLKGVVKNKRNGFIFITNKALTVKNRDDLKKIALKEDAVQDCVIFHLESIKVILDQPVGYGIRLEYLRIKLTKEEQFSYFTSSNNSVERIVERNGRLLNSINSKLDRVLVDQSFIMQTTTLSATKLGLDISPPPSSADIFLGGSYHAEIHTVGLSAKLSEDVVMAFHRALCFQLPSDAIGQFRTQKVYLSAPGKPISEAIPVDVKPEDLPALLKELCSGWRDGYNVLAKSTPELKITSVAKFHSEFLNMHPFVDGNGRVARFILMQQILDLFGRAEMNLFDKSIDYYKALQLADKNNYEALVKLLKPVAVFG